MENLDNMKNQRTEILNSLSEAIRNGDEKGAENATMALSKYVHDNVMAQVNGTMDTIDSNIMAIRGERVLTSQETKFYTGLIEAMKSSDPEMAISNLDVAYPETIIESVFEDIKTKFPLLACIDFKNTSILTKIIVNKQARQSAVWGAINSAIVTELSGNIGEIDLTMCKLSAFMYVSQDMLKLGPVWLDRYVRSILVESNGTALETAVVDGTGNNQPIGMTRSVADDVTVTGGVYPQKTATAVTSFSPATYGTLVSTLTTSPTGRQRPADDLILVVNPSDYLTKVMPATTMMTLSGVYARDIFPVPTKVVQAVGCPSGKAVLGLAKRYFMGMGSDKNGTITYSDEYKFLEDNRTYKTKMHGNGRPLDNNAFLFLDISGLTPVALPIATGGISVSADSVTVNEAT